MVQNLSDEFMQDIQVSFPLLDVRDVMKWSPNWKFVFTFLFRYSQELFQGTQGLIICASQLRTSKEV